MTNQENLNRQLSTAALKGDAASILSLLTQGAEIEAQDCNGDTALISVTMYDDEELVRILLSAGADIEAQNNVGDTALMRASRFNYPDTVLILLEAGAETDVTNANGRTALMMAQARGCTKVVALVKSAIEKRQLLSTIKTGIESGVDQIFHF